MGTRNLLAERHRRPIRIPMRPSIGGAEKASSIRVAADSFAGPDRPAIPAATDLVLENLQPRSVEARLSFDPGLGSAPLSIPLSLAPFETVELPDVLATRFGVSSGEGNLELLDASGAVAMAARTYSREPGRPAENAEAARLAAGLLETDDFSTEIEASNGTAAPEVFAARLYSGAGVLLGQREDLSVGSGESRSWSLQDLFPGVHGETITAEFSAAAGTNLPALRAAVTDLRTQSRFVFEAERAGSRVYVPAVGRTAGAGDTFLATDIAISNAGDASLLVHLRFLESNRDNTAAPAATLVLGPRESRTVDDVLGVFFGLTDVAGFLEVASDSPAIVVAGRQAARADGTPGIVGSAVQCIAAERFSTRSILFSPAGAWTSRIGLVNSEPEPLPAVVRWLDGRGEIVEETAVVVPGRSSLSVTADALLGGHAALVESERPHFALVLPSDRLARRPGDVPPRERDAR